MGFFDPNEQLETTNYDPIPDGEHECIVNAYQWKDAKSGGNYLEIEFAISGGDFDGRLVWERLNLINKNDMAVQIGREGLARFCRAMECTDQLGTEDDLFAFMEKTPGKKCMVKVKKQARKNDPDRIDVVVKNVKGMKQVAPAPKKEKPKAEPKNAEVDVKDPDKLPF